MTIPPWRLRGRTLPLDRACLMGIVNVTPDSFSDGGLYHDIDAAVEHAKTLQNQGALILDIGGESTRPGSDPVPVALELERTIPVIEKLTRETQAILSIDTTKSEVARAALEAGAHIVNDISGLGFDPHMAEVVASFRAGLVIMHIQGTPKTMQQNISYEDLFTDIETYFQERIALAKKAGISPEQIVLDPGIGFGKTVQQNYELLRDTPRLLALGHGLLIGTSRKSFLGATLDNKPPHERVWGTAATVAHGVIAGAHIFRVHDVGPMYDVLRVSEELKNSPNN